MFITYLRRELGNRKRQSAIVAIALAIAIALVMLVASFSAAVRSAQADALSSVYGVGTDITVSQKAEAPTEGGDGPGQRFDFDPGEGSSDADGQQFSQSRLTLGFGTTGFDASALDTIAATAGVKDAAGVLSLTNTNFSGEVPDRSQAAAPPSAGQAPQDAGPGGGGSFDVDATAVLGVTPGAASVGPLSDVETADGRMLRADDAGADVVILDAAYATASELAVGDTLTLGGTEFTVVGTVASTTDAASTAADAYIPLDVAQSLAGAEGTLSTVYVSAASADEVSDVQDAVETALPDLTVSTQADLAQSVSGSLATATQLVSSLGLWLSVLVIAVAFLIAALFTVSGVTRRTREFGTLKAIGWTSGRVVRQVAAESVTQGLIGGAIGVAIGCAAIAILNAVGITLSGSATTAAAGPGRMDGGFPGGASDAAASATPLTLSLPVDVTVIALAVGLAVLGGLIAGAIGGWRASHLRPAAALRSIS
ncbi:FtsX-like permease family protein [Paramicrobacterium humi]|uniref:FtsX-like permease family protein n=1 Tax=Paramicrobacterium humi TaxID=640635 RepID=A0A1H4J265_9MICO|nr:ABC transporter permease [Microbacterium humi]SEB40301.1 FtsX-like permease family protein [Microbacterium humi]